jgi:DnaJ-class molecular chaperone
MKYCKHSLPIEQCSYCNGDYDKVEQEKLKYKLERAARREYKIKWRTLQADSLARATNHKQPLTTEMYTKILVNIDGYDKRDVDVLYRVAIEMGRSLSSICWIWNFAYANCESLNIRDGEERDIYLKIQAIKSQLRLQP